MNCIKATQLLSEAQDRKLTTSERLRLKIHVLICVACRRFGQHASQLREMARQYTQREGSK